MFVNVHEPQKGWQVFSSSFLSFQARLTIRADASDNVSVRECEDGGSSTAGVLSRKEAENVGASMVAEQEVLKSKYSLGVFFPPLSQGV